jgi:hypothetical protein
LDRRLGGLQNRSGGGGEEKNSQSLPGLNDMKIMLYNKAQIVSEAVVTIAL